MKCNCDKFDVPECCGRYLEDVMGNIVHTENVCYDVTSGTPVPLPDQKFPEWINENSRSRVAS